jgi:hypothetical protein
VSVLISAVTLGLELHPHGNAEVRITGNCVCSLVMGTIVHMFNQTDCTSSLWLYYPYLHATSRVQPCCMFQCFKINFGYLWIFSFHSLWYFSFNCIIFKMSISVTFLLPSRNVHPRERHFYWYLRSLNKTLWSESAGELHQPSDHRLSVKLVPTFAYRGCHVVSRADPYHRILWFLDFTHEAEWTPVPEPLLRKSGGAGNRTQTSGSLARNSLDHRGGLFLS